MIENVSFEKTTFEKPPMKFEAGTPPIASVMGLGAALDYIESIGRKEIAAYEEELRLYATEKLQAIEGLRILGTASHKGPIVTFTVEGAHSLDIGTFLDLKGISVRTGHLCAQPLLRRFGLTAAVRLSFAPYNTVEEIDLCVAALHEILVQVCR
jgi:cysteine desulfurase/selenocysteine lyase